MAELDSLTTEQLQAAAREYDDTTQRFDIAPTGKQLIGRVTIFCLVLNRTIGSGIFTVPARVLSGTGSVGGSLLVWSTCGIIVLCGCCCWLELGLSIPMVTVEEKGGGRQRVSAPRSGGEKNFIEYAFKRPRFLATCVYGILYLVFGNISGNGIAFGIYVMKAAGRDPYSAEHDYWNGPVIALAITALTVCALLHVFSRRGGILVNNTFAFLKIGMLLTIIIMGFIQAGAPNLSKGISEPAPGNGDLITSADINNASATNFDGSFTTLEGLNRKGDLGSFTGSFINALFSYTGFEQPFYVLSEVRNPRRTFPSMTLLSMLVAIVLYVLTNVSYYCVVPAKAYLNPAATGEDIAGLFFHYLFDSSSEKTAKQVMAGLTALSIFGNILVMTFTAARVKQEIAKEGILPFSLFFASGHTTPWAKLRNRSKKSHQNTPSIDDSTRRQSIRINGEDIDDPKEQSPMAALALHWTTSVILIAISVPWKQPTLEYSFLITLYSYVNICVIGFMASLGLIYLKIDSITANRRNWKNNVKWTPWLNPLPAIIFFLATLFFLCTAFVPPKDTTSPFHSKYIKYPHYLVPVIGVGSVFMGVFWWIGLNVLQRWRRRELVVSRTPYLVKDDDGNYVQKLELVVHEWRATVPYMDPEIDDDHSGVRMGELRERRAGLGDRNWD